MALTVPTPRTGVSRGSVGESVELVAGGVSRLTCARLTRTFSGGPVSMELSGATALVTGATAGIGRAVARQLAALGAEVVVHGRDPLRGAETVNEITAAGGRARFVTADLADPDEVRRLAVEAGDIDVLVNNAGSRLRFMIRPSPGRDATTRTTNDNHRPPMSSMLTPATGTLRPTCVGCRSIQRQVVVFASLVGGQLVLVLGGDPVVIAVLHDRRRALWDRWTR
jgi:NAD(P)-dependent dehydrogenase (short-subunit alcohol dehydrogenase family)